MGGKWLKKACVEEKHDLDKAFEDFRSVLGSAASVLCDHGPHHGQGRQSFKFFWWVT